MRLTASLPRLIRGRTAVQWRAMPSRAARAIFGLVLPPRCVWCLRDDADFAEGPLLCNDCQRMLCGTPTERCRRCGGALALATATVCPHCHGRKLRFDRVVTLGTYTAALRECELTLKRPGHEALSAAMGQWLAARAAATFHELQADAVLAVPMHWARRMTRRANNAELIAAALAARLKLPTWHRALRRVRNTRKQGPMLRTQRLKNVRRAFRLQPECDVHGKRLIIVDDVLTTGATCNEIAKILKRAGAASVTVAVLARAETGR
jgi:ComF family protein